MAWNAASPTWAEERHRSAPGAFQHLRGGLRRDFQHDKRLALLVLRHKAALELPQPQHAFRDQAGGGEVLLREPLQRLRSGVSRPQAAPAILATKACKVALWSLSGLAAMTTSST